MTYRNLDQLIEVLGPPYAGVIDGIPVGSKTPLGVQITITVATGSGEGAEAADYCRWDCFRVLSGLEAGVLDVLAMSDTVRIDQYSRALQTLQPLISCAVIRDRDNGWRLMHVCCKHETVLRT